MLLIRIFLAAAILLSEVTFPKEEFVVVKESKIAVQASTSLGNINCSYTSSSRNDTILIKKQLLGKERFRLLIPVEKFNCGNLILNKDFAKTLNAKKHPQIKIELISFQKQKQSYIGSLRLEIAGKPLQLEDVQFNTCSTKNVDQLTSNICLNFSELGISVPKKMGGLFKVEDEMQITVALHIQNEQQGKANSIAAFLNI